MHLEFEHASSRPGKRSFFVLFFSFVIFCFFSPIFCFLFPIFLSQVLAFSLKCYMYVCMHLFGTAWLATTLAFPVQGQIWGILSSTFGSVCRVSRVHVLCVRTSQGRAVDASLAPAGRAESETKGSSQGGAVDASSAPAGRTESETRGSPQGGASDLSLIHI